MWSFTAQQRQAIEQDLLVRRAVLLLAGLYPAWGSRLAESDLAGWREHLRVLFSQAQPCGWCTERAAFAYVHAGFVFGVGFPERLPALRALFGPPDAATPLRAVQLDHAALASVTALGSRWHERLAETPLRQPGDLFRLAWQSASPEQQQQARAVMLTVGQESSEGLSQAVLLAPLDALSDALVVAFPDPPAKVAPAS